MYVSYVYNVFVYLFFQLKEKVVQRDNVFASSGKLVENAIKEVKAANPTAILPQPNLMQRRINRHRQDTRPAHPMTLDFDLDEFHIPEDFLVGDVREGSQRHLVFATSRQLSLLSRAVHWYLDGTFKVVRKPFVQLFGIHAFVRRGHCMKQVPMGYILMSRRTTPDYAAVLRIILRALPADPAVKIVTTDFEGAIWQGVRRVLPGVEVQGCGFHWAQAVERQFGEHGLAAAYLDSSGPLRGLLRRLLALPYLPPAEIPGAFERLQDVALEQGDCRLMGLFEYVRSTWFESGIWTVASWSVYNRVVRTNNDCEGWHRRLNTRMSENVNLYLLIQGLEEESLLVDAQVELVKDMRLSRLQKPSYTRLQQRTMTAWHEFEAGHLTADQLLRRLSLFVRS